METNALRNKNSTLTGPKAKRPSADLLAEIATLKQRIESLRQSESRCREASMDLKRLATVIHDAYDAITMQELDGTITSWNRGAEQMYGYSASEAIGMNIAELIPAGKRREQAGRLKKLHSGRALASYETQRLTRDKRILDVWLTQTVLKDDAGKPVAIATTERDITARKKQEKENARLLGELVRSNGQLNRLNRFKDKIMAMVAHDLRNPLFAISGFTRFLLDSNRNENLSEKQLDMVKRIHKAGEYMGKLINHLVDFQKIEQGKLTLQRETHDLAAVVRERIDLCELAARNKDIRFLTRLKDVPRFKFDKTRIEQVIDNLISNAVKYSPPGSSIELALSAEGTTAAFSVKDEGPGISRENQKLLFGEFETLGAKPTGGEDAIGLGLNIVKGLVQLHGGSVQVDSEPGAGATFSVRLPMKPPAKG